MKNHHKGQTIHQPAPQAVSHDDIARRARELWNERGQPQNQDDEIWLEAERQLSGDSTQAQAERKLPVSF